MKRLLFVPALFLSIILAGCGPTFISECEKRSRASGDNQTQVDLVCEAGANKYYFLENKNGTLYVRYGLVSWKDLEQESDDQLKRLDNALNPLNKEDAQIMETFDGQKEYLERQETIVRTRRQIYRTAGLHDLFQNLMNQSSFMAEEKDGRYDIRKIAMPQHLTETFPFTDDKIEAAKKNGVLKLIDHVLWSRDTDFYKKDINTEHPDDPNEFVWKSWRGGLELFSYQIQTVSKPGDNLGDYIEGYRIINGKKESKPALKIFFPSHSPVAVVVIDSDKENEPGFNLPDFVDQLIVSDLTDIQKNGDVIGKIFKEKSETRRKTPAKKENKPEVARSGEPLNLWEKCPDNDGCSIPKYRGEMGNGYSLRIEFDNGTGGEEAMTRGVKYVAKEYLINKTTEYYRPKPEFQNVLSAEAFGKRVRFIMADGSEVSGVITPGPNKFIENEPYAIAYTEGQKRWWAEKSPGSKVFDKRKEISRGEPDGERNILEPMQ